MSIIRDRFNIDIRTGWSIERKTDAESEHFDNPNEYCMVDQYTDQFGNFLDCGVTLFVLSRCAQFVVLSSVVVLLDACCHVASWSAWP